MHLDLESRLFLPGAGTAFAVAVLVMGQSTVLAAPVEWPVASGGSGHFYELVRVQIDFAGARTAAEAMSYHGVTGHLATVDLNGEASWLWGTLTLPATPELEDYWLGASVPASSFGDITACTWVTGEPVTSEQRSFPGEPWYIDWYEGYGDYGLAQIPRAGWTSGWLPQDIRQDLVLNGFVVEFPVPEPASALLLLVAACAVWRRRS